MAHVPTTASAVPRGRSQAAPPQTSEFSKKAGAPQLARSLRELWGFLSSAPNLSQSCGSSEISATLRPPRRPPARAPSTPAQSSDTTQLQTADSLHTPDTATPPDPTPPVHPGSALAITGTPPPTAPVDPDTTNVPEIISPIPESLHEDQQHSMNSNDSSFRSPGINFQARKKLQPALHWTLTREVSCEKKSKDW